MYFYNKTNHGNYPKHNKLLTAPLMSKLVDSGLDTKRAWMSTIHCSTVNDSFKSQPLLQAYLHM